MLESVRVVHYRGFKDLTVSGLGRVNLVIGKNNAGKTSWIAAAGSQARNIWTLLRVPYGATAEDRARHWLPLFHEGDETAPLRIEVRDTEGVDQWLSLRPVTSREQTRVGAGAWWYLQEEGGNYRFNSSFRADLGGLRYETSVPHEVPVIGTQPGSDLSEFDRDKLRELAVNGQLERVVSSLRSFDPRIETLELIGDDVFVKLVDLKRRLPLKVLGDGAYAILDVALTASAPPGTTITYDEIDSSLHHSVLPDLWRLIREDVKGQVFATTHRDESVEAASSAFLDAGDDGLRIIRLDRTADGHRAVVYSAEEALHAIENGWEIRG